MGFTLLAYVILAFSGATLLYSRLYHSQQPGWFRSFHFWIGVSEVFLVLLLLAIGIVGTLGHYGDLGHSSHLLAGLSVVVLTLTSAWSANQIDPQRPWARSLHLGTNLLLLVSLVYVSWTGWEVVQKYLET